MVSIIVFVLINAIILIFAVISIVQGFRNSKKSDDFPEERKKMKMTYHVTSLLHMWAGILVVLCYIGVGIVAMVSS